MLPTKDMKDAGWYWHRVRAMSFEEMALHLRKKWRQRLDTRALPSWTGARLEPADGVPRLPDAADASARIATALRDRAECIRSGRWCAFGHLELEVDVPPVWHKDYLSGRDLTTRAPAARLNHRALPAGCDVKLIWELSRWYQPLQLAQAAHVLSDAASAALCIRLLEDWVKANPPYLGWNWTSALESGMRLVQFTWIDALLSRCGFVDAEALRRLRQSVLPPHIHHCWHYRSFGSSANNHLLGELTGLILATARWGELQRWGAPLAELRSLWETEVMRQFAVDGGNREQALNYQLFSFEFCWQSRQAILGAGLQVSAPVEMRLRDAARFFWEVQVRQDPWDYGDSDSAYVSPFFEGDREATQQWHAWVEGRSRGDTIRYWLGKPPGFVPGLSHGQLPHHSRGVEGWYYFPESGVATQADGMWWWRWDLSPLGYLATAAHGHLDALHLSIWYQGVAFVVDPGTGAYYADASLRNWLASRHAHNAPCPSGVPEWPQRMGPFLWKEHHGKPAFEPVAAGAARGSLDLGQHRLERTVRRSAGGSSWVVEDRCLGGKGEAAAFSVRWQFAPGTLLRMIDNRTFVLSRNDRKLRVDVGSEWDVVVLHEIPSDPVTAAPGQSSWEGWVSPAFRKVVRAPFLLLSANPSQEPSQTFRTSFSVPDPLTGKGGRI